MPLTFKVARFGSRGFEGQEVDRRLLWLCQATALAGCQQGKCNIICSKLSTHTEWHKAAYKSSRSDNSFSCRTEQAKKTAHTLTHNYHETDVTISFWLICSIEWETYFWVGMFCLRTWIKWCFLASSGPSPRVLWKFDKDRLDRESENKRNL